MKNIKMRHVDRKCLVDTKTVSILHNTEFHKSRKAARQVWWGMPLIPALGRH